jgi:hypothetical protein
MILAEQGIGIFVEPTTGIEPVNLFLTKEVLYLLSYVGFRSCSQTRGLEKVHNVKGMRGHLELKGAPAGIFLASRTQRM